MNREYHRWYSPNLGRDMELLVFGHHGARVLVFPTSQGKYFEWEDRGMINALSHHINQGWLQLYCVDSVDAESWYCNWAHPSGRAYRHEQYDRYLLNEVLPLSTQKNDNPFLITVGASFGAYHAMNFGLKHPDKVDRILGMSGIYDISYWTDGYVDDNVYFNNPVMYIPQLTDHQQLEMIRHIDIIIAGGNQDRLFYRSEQMSQVLWDKGIWHAFRSWNGWHHDWPDWEKMILMYINGAN